MSALTHSEMHLDAFILDTIEGGVMILDDSLYIHYWNQWLTSYTALSKNKAIGQRIDNLFSEVNYRTLMRKVKSTIALNSPTFYQASSSNYLLKLVTEKITNPLFEYMQQNVVIAPYNAEERLVALMIYDCTPVAEAQARLKSTLGELKKLNNELNYQMGVIDQYVPTLRLMQDGTVLSINHAFCNAIDISPAEIQGKNIRDVLPLKNIDTDVFLKELTKHSNWQGELQYLKKNSETVWLNANITTETSPSSEALIHSVICQDITDKKEVEFLSITDPLTGAFNRNRFNQACTHEIDMARRYGPPLSLVIIDIDHFKSINDTHGHLAGDSVLKEISTIIKQNIRSTDIFARWGGEEFMLLLPQTSQGNACTVAEKLRGLIEKYQFTQVGHITASFGISQFSNGNTQESLIQRCDDALYEAKHLGRNRVIAKRICSEVE